MSDATNRHTPTVALIIIGDEILSGKINDTNSEFLRREVRELGAQVIGISIIPDRIDRIAENVRYFREQVNADWIITTGGVGPTHDDVSIAGIAKGMDLAVSRHPEIEAALLKYFGEASDEQLSMADIPEGAYVTQLDSPFPLIQAENVFILPGIPALMEAKFTGIRPLLNSEPFVLRNVFYTAWEDEVAPLLTRISNEFPDVAVGSYPTITETEYKTKLTFESKDGNAVEKAVEMLMAEIDEAKVLRVD